MDSTHPNITRCLTNRRLHLIPLATESCNFRCTYCYEDFNGSRMEARIVKGLKRLLSRRIDDLDELILSWFGGEPLLALDIVEDVQQHVCSLTKKRSDVYSHTNMTTNAYLLNRKVFERLLELGVTQYQVSFDGPREWHDRKRMLVNGRGTFDRIWRNLLSFRNVNGDFSVTLRVHVDKENQGAVPGFIDQCRDAFGDDARFPLFIRPLSRFGSPNDRNIRVLEGGMKDERIHALRNLATDRGLEHRACSDEFPVCYAAAANSLILRADGRLNKCSVAMELAENQVGCLKEDGTVLLEKSRMLGWMRGLKSGDSQELSCPLIRFSG